ncbi:MAG: hypothetical protein AMXMBFR16_13270 [Candidatus Uhrbacteria bacterium]
MGIARMTSQPEATETGLPGKQRFVLHLKKPQGIDGVPAPSEVTEMHVLTLAKS